MLTVEAEVEDLDESGFEKAAQTAKEGCPVSKALAGTTIDPLDADHEIAIGSVTIRALLTPGHTPDHKSYLVIENGVPKALFSAAL